MKILSAWFIFGIIATIIPYYSGEIVKSHQPTVNTDYISSLSVDLTDLNEVSPERSRFTISPDDIQTIIDVTRLGLGLIDGIRNLFDKNFNGSAFNHIEFDGIGEEQLLSMFHTVSKSLNDIQAGVAGTQIGLRQLVSSLPHLVRWEIALSSISEYALPINSLYHKFNYYQLHREEVEDHTLSDFATSVITHDTGSIQSLMANIHAMIAPDDPPTLTQKVTEFEREEYTVSVDRRVNAKYSSKLRRAKLREKGTTKEDYAKIGNIYFRPSIFSLLVNALEGSEICSMQQSPQAMVYGFYALLALTQARGYAMMKFSWLLLSYYKEGDFVAEQRLSDELYMHYSRGLQREVIKALSRASTIYRKCDPKVHKEGSTFEMMKELLQGYIENEVDLSERRSCTHECADYKHAEVKGCYMPESQYCGKHRRCGGTLHDCSFMYSDAYVCISEVPYKRYDWIRYKNLAVLGREGSCQKLMDVHSWWRFLYHCSYCVCYCDDESSSATERYISLMPSVSDILQNKIITGVRFVKKNKIMHLQIRTAKTKPQGHVDLTTQKWIEVDPVSIDNSKYVAGEHYAVLKYEARNIDLDTLKAPRGHVVTGFRFRLLGAHHNLEMLVTPVNFTNGTLQPHSSYWISNSNTPAMQEDPRKEISLKDPIDPRYAVIENEIRSKANTFIKMCPTSLQSDVAQLTVPFFDAQEVAPEPPVWLQGIDLYFRGTGNSGGFLGLAVHNYNMTSHFLENVF